MKNGFGIRLLFTSLFALTLFTGCKEEPAKPKVVTVMTYSEYIDPAMIEDFEKKTGYKLQLDLYEAQEEMLGKLQVASANSQYDVIIASDVVIPQMIRKGIITSIDSLQIPNRVNVAEKFKHAIYDPTSTYTWPYLWGSTGVLYRDSKVDPNKFSYSLVFDKNEQRGKFTLLEESRSMISIALLALGLDPNATNFDDINKAVQFLVDAKRSPNFVSFEGSVAGKDKVLSGEAWASFVFSGEAMAAIAADSSLQYAIPQEGSFVWVDLMTLSAAAPNPEGAYAFMNYILDAQNGAQLAKYISYATPNKAALELLDSTYLNNKVINPDEATMERLVFPGDAVRLYDEGWALVKMR